MKYFVLIILSVGLFGCGTLQKPFLYKAEKDNKKIYFFGSLHLGVGSWEIPDEIESELKSSSVAFFETDANIMDSTSPAGAKFRADSKANAKENLMIKPDSELTLDLRLTPAEFSFLVGSIKELSRDQIKYLRPHAAEAVFLRHDEVLVRLGEYAELNGSYSIDLALYREAQKLKKPIVTLDRDDIDKMCRSEFDGEGLASLKRVLKGERRKHQLQKVRDLVEAYRSGSESQLAKIIFEGEVTQKCILEDRNRDWAKILDRQMIDGGKAFVTVGVGHLIDDPSTKSVLQFLREDGYSIARVQETEEPSEIISPSKPKRPIKE